MMAHMSDGWSTDGSNTKTVRVGDQPVRHVGRWRGEFLAEKDILKVVGEDGHIRMALRSLPPLSVQGKTGWDV